MIITSLRSNPVSNFMSGRQWDIRWSGFYNLGCHRFIRPLSTNTGVIQVYLLIISGKFYCSFPWNEEKQRKSLKYNLYRAWELLILNQRQKTLKTKRSRKLLAWTDEHAWSKNPNPLWNTSYQSILWRETAERNRSSYRSVFHTLKRLKTHQWYVTSFLRVYQSLIWCWPAVCEASSQWSY